MVYVVFENVYDKKFKRRVVNAFVHIDNARAFLASYSGHCFIKEFPMTSIMGRAYQRCIAIVTRFDHTHQASYENVVCVYDKVEEAGMIAHHYAEFMDINFHRYDIDPMFIQPPPPPPPPRPSTAMLIY